MKERKKKMEGKRWQWKEGVSCCLGCFEGEEEEDGR